MANNTLSLLTVIMPDWLVKSLRANPSVRRLVRRWVRGRPQQIPHGVGAGLWFDPGPSNPDYALGTNEQPVQTVLAQHLRAGDTFYDIGGNVGFFTVIGAHLVGATGHVYAFEPVPENAAMIRRNVAKNGFRNVTLFEKAVAQSKGRAALYVAEYSGGAALVSAGEPPDLKETIMVDSVAIDDLVEQQAVKPPTVVKIDVEGAELDVLRGMAATLQTHKPLIVYEVDGGSEAAFHTKVEVCAQFLRAAGYELMPLEDSYPDAGWIVGHFLAVPKR